MKRIHLFEFEDFSWFPNWVRICMTRLIVVMHKILGTREELAELIAKILKETNSSNIIDLCSGSGGPMLDIVQILNKKHGLKNINLTLTDLYPDLATAKGINHQDGNKISYQTNPVNATNVDYAIAGLRTMVGSFHHMTPSNAKRILESSLKSRQPICIFEISDNSFPIFLWWIALPINFMMCLFITPLVRPLTWQQIVFTYLIPIIPLCFAWDGAVSNARTYTLSDMDKLLEGLESEDYKWEKGLIKGKSKKLYLLGLPV